MTLGVYDLERFTEGDCHYLARALHVRTGWPIMAFCCDEGLPDTHAFVLMPDGRALDVEGPCDLDTFRKRWSSHRIMQFDWPTLRRNFLTPHYGKYTYSRAKVVADRLLRHPDVQAVIA